MSEVFKKLHAKDVSNYTTQKKSGKQTLTYLSWAHAWAEVKKEYPDANYEIKKFENNLPYVYDEETGYMVFTEVTIEEQTHEMWLPVMDHNNLAMLNKPYEKKFKYSTAKVDAATMFDINKTIMRCLTKNLAMFGLGLYIYAGEDLPEAPPVEIEYATKEDISIVTQKIERIAEYSVGDTEENKKKLITWALGQAKVKDFSEIQKDHLQALLDLLDRMIAKNKPKEESEQTSLMDGNTTKAKGSD